MINQSKIMNWQYFKAISYQLPQSNLFYIFLTLSDILNISNLNPYSVLNQFAPLLFLLVLDRLLNFFALDLTR